MSIFRPPLSPAGRSCRYVSRRHSRAPPQTAAGMTTKLTASGAHTNGRRGLAPASLPPPRKQRSPTPNFIGPARPPRSFRATPERRRDRDAGRGLPHERPAGEDRTPPVAARHPRPPPIQVAVGREAQPLAGASRALPFRKAGAWPKRFPILVGLLLAAGDLAMENRAQPSRPDTGMSSSRATEFARLTWLANPTYAAGEAHGRTKPREARFRSAHPHPGSKSISRPPPFPPRCSPITILS